MRLNPLSWRDLTSLSKAGVEQRAEASRLAIRRYQSSRSPCRRDGHLAQKNVTSISSSQRAIHHHRSVIEGQQSLQLSESTPVFCVGNKLISRTTGSSFLRNRGAARNFHTSTSVSKTNAESVSYSDSVRSLMRHVPHPVAVITSSGPATTVDKERDVSYTFRGATISSFVTVTLHPTPIICFNIMKLSSTFQAIEESNLFRVHLMNKCIEAESIATKFAGGNESKPFHDARGKLARWVVVGQDKMDSLEARQPPRIGGVGEGGSDIVAFWFRCKYLKDKTVEVGDHVVVFGEVLEINPSATKGAREPCLVYVDGRYSQVKS